jgi:hypothetical protein
MKKLGNVLCLAAALGITTPALAGVVKDGAAAMYLEPGTRMVVGQGFQVKWPDGYHDPRVTQFSSQGEYSIHSSCFFTSDDPRVLSGKGEVALDFAPGEYAIAIKTRNPEDPYVVMTVEGQDFVANLTCANNFGGSAASVAVRHFRSPYDWAFWFVDGSSDK